MSHGPLDPAQDAATVERVLKLHRESDGRHFDETDADGELAHLCPPMSVRERRSAPRPTIDGWEDVSMPSIDATTPFTVIEGSHSWAWTYDIAPAPRIPRHREGINLGKFIAVLGVMVGGAALLVAGAVLYMVWAFRFVP